MCSRWGQMCQKIRLGSLKLVRQSVHGKSQAVGYVELMSDLSHTLAVMVTIVVTCFWKYGLRLKKHH
jgi:hypothetical protein